jgi:hypothetical protein
MEKHKHPLDDFFREELKDFRAEPSATGREAFLKEADSLLRKGGARKRWFILPILLVLVAGIATGIYFGSPETPGTDTVSKTEPEKATVMVNSAPATPDRTGKPASSSSLSSTNKPIAKQTRITETPVMKPQLPAESAKHESPVTAEKNLSVIPDTSYATAPLKDTIAPQTMKSPEPSSAGTSVVADTVISYDTLKDEPVPPHKKTKRSYSARKDLEVMIGVQYTPEWMFNTLEGDKYVSNFGLESTFRFGRYSIRTGAGLSITQGTNELVVDYNEYEGSYNALDSITFQWDDQHYNLLPTYYLRDQNVWDTAVTQEQHKLIKRYTYLQIPLVLGYDFLEKGWFSMGFRAGPVLSLLLNSEQLSAQYDPGKDKVIAINQVTPDRIQTNWQVMGGLNFGFAVSRRWVLELEPEARYYFNSVYEKSDITKKPWSIGIRAAISFDLKK